MALQTKIVTLNVECSQTLVILLVLLSAFWSDCLSQGAKFQHVCSYIGVYILRTIVSRFKFHLGGRDHNDISMSRRKNNIS